MAEIATKAFNVKKYVYSMDFFCIKDRTEEVDKLIHSRKSVLGNIKEMPFKGRISIENNYIPLF